MNGSRALGAIAVVVFGCGASGSGAPGGLGGSGEIAGTGASAGGVSGASGGKAGGSTAGGAGGSAGAPALGPECVQLTLDAAIQIPLQAVFHDPNGLHVIWQTWYMEPSSCIVHVDSYSVDGKLLTTRELATPTCGGELGPGYGGLNYAALSDSGSFVLGDAAYAYERLDDPKPLTLATPWPEYHASRIAWDGISFTTQLNDGGFSYYARIAEDGAPLIGPQKLAYIAGGVEGRHYRIETDPVTGVTMSNGITGGVGMYLSAHTREGAYSPGVGPDGTVLAVPANDDHGDGLSLALENGHAMFTWSGDAGLHVGYVSQLDLNDVTSYVVPLPDVGHDIEMQTLAPASDLGDDVFWLAGQAYDRIDEVVLHAKHQRSRRVLILPQSNHIPEPLDLRDMRALSYGSERWLSFRDFSNAHGGPGGAPVSEHWPLRIVRVLDGCTYQTQYDLDRQAGK